MVYAFALFSNSLGIQGKKTALLSIAGFSVVLFSYTVVNLFFSTEHVFR
jgi:ABC-type transport system involved in cytochrome c biogenesis permease subunit